MKFNFRKIASVLASAVMLSSTVALAAAANFPAPFVSNGVGDYAVVYGAGQTLSDGVAAADINSFLTQRVTTPSTPVVVTNSTPTDGEFVQIQRANNKFNLGDAANQFQSSLDSTDLPTVLADGTYTNDPGSDFDYTQTIKLGALNLSMYQSNDFNNRKPFVGFYLPTSGATVMNYTLEFTPDAAEGGTGFADLKNTVINMLGRDYYISNAEATSNGVKLTLLDAANSLRITEGDTQTVTVGNDTVKIKVVSISGSGSDASVSLAVNDVELSSDLSAGETAKVRGTNTYVGVKKISTSSRESTAQSAVITIGTGQITLENGVEVQLNGKDLSTLTEFEDWTVIPTIVNDTTNINDIELSWTNNAKVALLPGQSWTMPGFAGVKLSMGDFVTPTPEVTTFQDSSDSAQVSTEIKDGAVDFSLFFANETDILGPGNEESEQLVTNPGTDGSQSLDLNTENSTFFAATWIDGDNAETYMFSLDSIGSVADGNHTVLKNYVTGNTFDIGKVGADKDYPGSALTFTATAASKADGTATVTVASNSGGHLYTDRIATKAGLTIGLPNSTAMTNAVAEGASGSFTTTITEADPDNSDVDAGSSFDVTLSPSSDGSQPTDVTGNFNTAGNLFPEERSSDTKVGYLLSDLATYVIFNDASSAAKDLTVQYHPTESYGQVYVTESKVQLGEGGSGGGSAGTLVVTDAQVSTVQGKNLLVVGGSCVNTVAAKLLGSDTPICEAAWTSATTAGAGAFLIKTYANPWTSGKVATLVAGYDAADTTNAVNALKTETIDTTVGKGYVKLAGQQLQLV